MLNWRQVECWQAETPSGSVYQISESWIPGKRYIAVLNFQDRYGRVYSHVVGLFDTVYDAKKACESDAKDSRDTTRVVKGGEIRE